MKKKIKSLILKAKKGNPQSQHELAFEYWSGENLKQDFSEAMKWWKLSASKDFGKAYYNLGAMYANGDGVPVNYKKAYYYHNLSTKKKHTHQSTSYFFLGQNFFLEGKCGKKNTKKGIKYLEIASKKNLIAAQYILGSYYETGEKKFNIKKDKIKAFKYFKMSADNKFIPGLRIIASKYANGEDVNQDLEKAYNYLNMIEAIDNDKLIDDMAIYPDVKIKLKKMINKEKIRVSKMLFNIRKAEEKNG